MQKDTRFNRIIAAIVFLISWLVYLRTVAPTTSFWDCGEFITCSYILGVPHPPGAPLYILIGRIFSMIPFVQDIGMRVNIISTLASAITVMFAYLIIVRLITLFRGRVKDNLDRLIVYGSGLIGALTFAFTDSFWFNAVEAEVYAISMFFTSLVLWLILVWHENADDPQSDKYLLLIAFSLGLAIGVHLLMILAMPALFLIVYFRKYQKIEWKNFWLFVGLSFLAFVALYPGIVKWLPNLSLFLKRKAGAEFTAFFFIVFIAALIYGVYYAYRTRKRLAFLIVTSFFLVLLASSTYTSLYIRSGLEPEIDENDPDNLENLVSYLNREQYGDWSYVDRRAPLWEYQIEKMYLRYFGWQFIGQGQTLDDDGRIVENYSLNGLLGLPFLVGLIGMAFHFRKDWKNASAIMLLFLFTGIAIVLYLNQEDPQPRERDYVYVGSFFAFALWIGIGITAITDYLRQLSSKFPSWQKLLLVAIAMILLAFILPANMLAHNFKSHDRTGEYVAYDYSYNILQSCEPNAILFTNGDNDTFPLWFLQYVYGIRKDVRVVNLSLLNTHWYIMQLRDQEPRVPISLSDTQILSLQPQYWPEARPIRLEVPREVYLRDRSEVLGAKQTLLADTSKPPEITFKLEPTLYGKGIRVQDLMILDILRTNRFRRPVYFALTVSRDNQINLYDYLRMDGLVFKIVTYPTKEEPLSPTHLQANLFEKFQYRNLNNPDVYYNENIKGLLRNYQGAFYSLAQFYGRERMFDKMTMVLDKLTTVMPDSIIPVRKELQFEMGRLYYIGGQQDKFKEILFKMINRSDVTLDEKLQYASYYTQLYPTEATKAVAVVKQLLERYPKNSEPTYWLASYYLRTREYQNSLDILNQWIARNPNDKNAADQLRSLNQLIEQSKRADSTAKSSGSDSVRTQD